MLKRIIPKIDGLLHGGDYNPEQWSKDIWQKDMDLMTGAKFDVATLGVFSWSQLEKADGQYEFGWLDEIFELLHKNGRHVVLATPSAAMPAWLSQAHPEVLRTGPDGVRMRHGNRVNFCWSSPVYREKVRQISEQLAIRYGDHPALASWHASNEYSDRCFCQLCTQAFRRWLQAKFNYDLDALNQAYWTTFWSHTYTDWSQIHIPAEPHGERSIIGLTLDWYRFCSDNIIDFYKQESEPLRRLSPHIPVTTNLMGFYPVLNSQKLAEHVDFLAWDSYPCFINEPIDANAWVSVAMTHDLNRSLKNQPFLMIESTPDGSNWYPVMRLKRPGMHALEAAQAVAHGSEGVMYFQWRKGRGSSEQYHGAVVGHDGTDQTRVYQEVAEVGQLLQDWQGVRGNHTTSQVGLVYDFEVNWAIELTHAPRLHGRDYLKTVKDHYRPLWEAGIQTDIISSEVDFSGYDLVIAPMLYMLKPGVAEKIRLYVQNGGTFVMSYWSAMVDENTLSLLGGYPGELRDVFGIWVEETDCLYDSETVSIQATEGNSCGLTGEYAARQYCERVHLEGAESIAEYSSEFYAGSPCVTRHSFGSGEAWFVASRNDEAFQTALSQILTMRAGVKQTVSATLPPGVTIQSRKGENSTTYFVMNFSGEPQRVQIDRQERETLEGCPEDGIIELSPNGFCVLTRQAVRRENAIADLPFEAVVR